MKTFNCIIEQIVAGEIFILMNSSNVAIFHFHTVFVQMTRTQLFLNIFLQVWYQNKDDIHLFWKIGYKEVFRNFFC